MISMARFLSFAMFMVMIPMIASADVEISEENFPDENFRLYLWLQPYGADGVITDSEIKNVTSIIVNDRAISSLKGIEFFTSLTVLYCYNNKLTYLDVSKNTALTNLQCGSNKLATLDVSNNTALTYLDCPYNNFTSLDVTKNIALKNLICWGNHQLTSLDVSKNTELTELDCSTNQLTNLDVSKNTELTTLSCSSNKLTSIDLSKNTALTELSCHSNQLTSLDLSKNTALTMLSCSSNKLTSIDLSKNTALTELSCHSNQLTVIDLSKNTALTKLDCYSNQLTSLNLSKNTALTTLYCYSNQLTSIDLSKNIALKTLNCSSNQLTSIDVTKSTALKVLTCWENQLTTLNLSKNTALEVLNCHSNQLTSLDLSKNIALTVLHCYGNKIKGSDMSTLVNSLPKQKKGQFYACTTSSNEENVCTVKQANIANEKGWTTFCYNYSTSTWEEYSGSAIDVVINEENFPDANFRAYLKSQSYGADGVIMKSEINSLTTIDVHGQGITSLKGIEYFIALRFLYCHENKIKGANMTALVNSLPRQKNEAWFIVCSSSSNEGNVCTVKQVAIANQKGWKVLRKNNGHSEIYSGSTEEVVINEENFPDAQFRAYLLNQSYGADGILSESEINSVVNIDVHGQGITSLKGIEYFVELQYLICYENQLSTLDITENTALQTLSCSNNQLSALDVTKNAALTSLNFAYNKVTSMDVSKNTALTYLCTFDNQLTSLDISNNIALETC